MLVTNRVKLQCVYILTAILSAMLLVIFMQLVIYGSDTYFTIIYLISAIYLIYYSIDTKNIVFTTIGIFVTVILYIYQQHAIVKNAIESLGIIQ